MQNVIALLSCVVAVLSFAQLWLLGQAHGRKRSLSHHTYIDNRKFFCSLDKTCFLSHSTQYPVRSLHGYFLLDSNQNFKKVTFAKPPINLRRLTCFWPCQRSAFANRKVPIIRRKYQKQKTFVMTFLVGRDPTYRDRIL
jgi:hypothetical protein